MSPMNANGSNLKVETNYGGKVETHQEARQVDYMRNQQTEEREDKLRTRTIVIDKDKGVKTTYKRELSADEEKVLKASAEDAAKRGVKKTRTRKTKTTKPTTDKE